MKRLAEAEHSLRFYLERELSMDLHFMCITKHDFKKSPMFLKPIICITILFLFMSILVLIGDDKNVLAQNNSYAPQYNETGQLVRPKETEKWIFVGSNLGLNYEEGATITDPSFHNVYITPSAYEAYKETGKFPEKTMLLLDRYAREGKAPDDPILTDGFFNGDRTGFEIAVKDSNRPNRFDGSQSEWAYYAFGGGKNLRATASPFPDASCQECHAKHASDDHVWVQFYPILRESSSK